jgi:hypothetical protein
MGPHDFTPDLMIQFAGVLLEISLYLLAIVMCCWIYRIAAIWADYRYLQRQRALQAQFDADLQLAREEEKISIREHLEEQLREAHMAQERG